MQKDEMILSDRIRVILKEMGEPERGKKSRLAKIAGCDRTIVNHWLTGQETIDYDHANAIASHFGYRLEWVRKGLGLMRPAAADEEQVAKEDLFIVHLNIQEMTLITCYRGATELGKLLIEAACKGAPQEPRHS